MLSKAVLIAAGRAASSTNAMLGLKSTEERSYGDWGADPWGRRRND